MRLVHSIGSDLYTHTHTHTHTNTHTHTHTHTHTKLSLSKELSYTVCQKQIFFKNNYTLLEKIQSDGHSGPPSCYFIFVN